MCTEQRVHVRDTRSEKTTDKRTGHIPSREAPYPARPRLPMAQTAGHRPATLGEPGSVTEARKAPPVKQNLFHVDIMPPCEA